MLYNRTLNLKVFCSCILALGAFPGLAEGSASSRKIKAQSQLLIPPPPAIPLSGSLSAGMFGMMSATDLKARRQELDGELLRAKAAVQDQAKRLDEKKQRAKQFTSLYAEGVVSRREMQSTEDDVTHGGTDLDAASQRVTDLERQMSDIDAALKQFAKPVIKPVSKKLPGSVAKKKH